MTIEVRQMVIKSSVGDDGDAASAPKRNGGCGGDKTDKKLKDEVLAECRTQLLEQLERLRER